jgi:hypothetical protein
MENPTVVDKCIGYGVLALIGIVPIGFLLFVAMLVAVLVACPPPPPPPPPPECIPWFSAVDCVCPEGTELVEILETCAPPRVDRPVDFGAARGITSFSLTLRSTRFIADFMYRAHEKGRTTFRTGAQTDGWGDLRSQAAILGIPEDEIQDVVIQDKPGYLPVGPPFGSPQWHDNLVRLLEVSARINDNWVQLIPTFTHKHYDKGSQAKNIQYFNNMFDRVHAIVTAGNYKHVFYEAFNEVVHPLAQHIKDEDVVEILKHIRKKAPGVPVGTDFHGEYRREDPWPGRYPFMWRPYVDYYSFHTRRNPEPTYADMVRAQKRWKYDKPVLIDETVCWASDVQIQQYNLRGKGTIAMRGKGNDELRMEQVQKHLREIRMVRNKYGLPWQDTYHYISGISCEEVGRIPPY